MRKLKVIITTVLLLVLITGIIGTFILVQKQQEQRLRASAIPTVIDIDLTSKRPLPRIWQNLAQGGEVPKPQLPQVVSQVKELQPNYIRIDHIFDGYELISSPNGQLEYDFTLLDKEVNGILATGALPFFSLSYITGPLTGATDERPNYSLWQQSITQLAKHYSGKSGKNLNGVIYECYNEPDLFGKWSASEYTSLYESCVSGVTAAQLSNQFSIGGPSITSYQPNFMKSFLQFVNDRNLRLDFISWHVYSRNPAQIANDVVALRELEKNYSNIHSPPIFITEWGSFPEKHLWHDTIYDVSHLVATVSQSLSFADRLFYFEIKDGESPNGEQYFGGWGLVTNEKFGLVKKPRFNTLLLLNRLKQFEFLHSGDNKNIFAIASGNSNTDLSILLTNYSYGQNSAEVTIPVRLRNLLPGIYSMQKTYLDGSGKIITEAETQFQSSDPIQIDLSSDSLVLLDIKRVSAVLQTVQGASNDPNDHGGRLIKGSEPLIYSLSPIDTSFNSSLSFSLRTDQALSSLPEGTIFQAKSNDGSIITLSLKPQGFGNELLLSIFPNQSPKVSFVNLPLPTLQPGEWHTIKIEFDNTNQKALLTLDGKTVSSPLLTPITFGDQITVGSALGEKVENDIAIDNLFLQADGKTILLETF